MPKNTNETESDEKVVEGTVVPDGAKKPQDRKPKASEESPTITVTVRDIEVTVDRDSLNDFELLDDLNELDQNENPARLPSVLRRLVGDQWKPIMTQLRDKDTGRVSVEDGAEFVGEVLEAVAPNS